ncbi:unnamed protein product [Dibothriocephalus latus]|uniref:Uncharacterized protein n=1 Tax=Dibothriocephalus latus TaxID=60516 RepID=A0A3P7M2S9_DIBLA|nr:unnamed protein product [Dibothriocephalus latus]
MIRLSKKLERVNAKDTVGWIEDNAKLLKAVNHRYEKLHVVGDGGTANRGVLVVGEDKNEVAKHSVYEPLEGLGIVTELNRHAQELKEVKWG